MGSNQSLNLTRQNTCIDEEDGTHPSEDEPTKSKTKMTTQPHKGTKEILSRVKEPSKIGRISSNPYPKQELMLTIFPCINAIVVTRKPTNTPKVIRKVAKHVLLLNPTSESVKQKFCCHMTKISCGHQMALIPWPCLAQGLKDRSVCPKWNPEALMTFPTDMHVASK